MTAWFSSKVIFPDNAATTLLYVSMISVFNCLRHNYSDVDKVKNGMAEKVSTTLQYVSMALSGLIVGLVYSWKVALVTLSVSPLLILATALMLKVGTKFLKR